MSNRDLYEGRPSPTSQHIPIQSLQYAPEPLIYTSNEGLCSTAPAGFFISIADLSVCTSLMARHGLLEC